MLHVSLLGEQVITDDATGIVRARWSRTVALIAFLAVHVGSPQTRRRVAGLFWPDSTDAQALTNLRRELHHLRQVLGDEPSLVVTSKDLCWSDTGTCNVDVCSFEMECRAAMAAAAIDDDEGVLVHADAALAQYRGELLPGVYDNWLLDARSELEDLCADVCDLAYGTRLRTGDVTGAMHAVRRRIQLQPFAEIGYRTLMELQADLGDRAGAVVTYHHFASLLQRELGVTPDRATQAALVRVLGSERSANASRSTVRLLQEHRGLGPEGNTMSMTATGAGVAPYEELAAALRGSLTTPDNPDYDSARAVYNAMIDKRPAAIARVQDVADVIACVRFGREHGLDIAVRGGAHNAAGFGTWDDALVIDLSLLRSTTVDPQNHTVRVDGGCTWGDVDHATVAFGMATPSGFLASTGVGGLALGGGMGYLSRRFGLTVDNLLAADVVLADGTFVTASDSAHNDLFWALRGGGGNFGVVTSFTFRCHDIGDAGTIIGGPVLYDFADTAEVMRWYRELLPTLPEELSGWLGLLTIPAGPPFPENLWGLKSCGIVWCYTGSPERADEILGPVKTYGSPLLVGLQSMPFNLLQSAFDALYPAGLQWYWRADFFNEITDAAIDVHVKYGAQLPTPHSTMHLYPIDGAVSRVAADATPFAYRDGGWAGVIVGVDPDPANDDLISQWAREYWEALHPTSAGGGYINFMMEEGTDRVKASYRGNYDRLTRVKALYDPDNIFHINQNIPPATAAAR